MLVSQSLFLRIKTAKGGIDTRDCYGLSLEFTSLTLESYQVAVRGTTNISWHDGKAMPTDTKKGLT